MIREGKSEGWLTLPTSALQSWASHNGASFHGVTVGPLPGLEDRGSTVIATKNLSGDDDAQRVLMTVPRDLILSLDNVHKHAKYDRDLRDILQSPGDFGRTARGAILAFLLLQCSMSCPSMQQKRGVKSPLSDYVKFLPLELLPTFWSDGERTLLKGTTLAPALSAKINALYREFEDFRTSTSAIEWCRTCWWDEVDGIVTFDDWLQIDAMYRSRALEFPGIGDCMAPCIDMANHSSGQSTVALYEVDPDGNAVLLLREDKTVEEKGEVNITYGDAKGACEMIFSYSFLEDGMESAKELFLDLSIPEDDPLRVAKAAICKTAPGFKIVDTGSSIEWHGDFIWLSCVNEEDGLEFAIAQTVDGDRELKPLWKDSAMPEIEKFRDSLEQEDMWPVYHLRATSILQERIAEQLHAIYEADEEVQGLASDLNSGIRDRPRSLALKLRTLEADLLEKAYSFFDAKKSELASTPFVQQYLGLTPQADTTQDDVDEDFS